jgi:hypothetical protein
MVTSKPAAFSAIAPLLPDHVEKERQVRLARRVQLVVVNRRPHTAIEFLFFGGDAVLHAFSKMIFADTSPPPTDAVNVAILVAADTMPLHDHSGFSAAAVP